MGSQVARFREITRLVRGAGVTVIEVPDWETRGYDALDPVGCVQHHTAGGTSPTNQRDVDEITNGRGGPNPLKGPLSNWLNGNQGTVWVIAARRARHAGPGAAEVLNRLERGFGPLGDAVTLGYDDAVDGNRRLLGIETDHPGDGSPLAPASLNSLVVLNWAICTVYEWPAARLVHHREWTRRKIDMSWRGDLRGMVAKRLAPPPAPTPTPTPTPQEDEVWLIKVADKPAVWLTTGLQRRHVRSQDELRELKATGIVSSTTSKVVSQATLDAIPIIV